MSDSLGPGQQWARAIIEVTTRLVADSNGVAVYWAPARAGVVTGNEKADGMAKEAAENRSHDVPDEIRWQTSLLHLSSRHRGQSQSHFPVGGRPRPTGAELSPPGCEFIVDGSADGLGSSAAVMRSHSGPCSFLGGPLCGARSDDVFLRHGPSSFGSVWNDCSCGARAAPWRSRTIAVVTTYSCSRSGNLDRSLCAVIVLVPQCSGAFSLLAPCSGDLGRTPCAVLFCVCALI